MALREGQKFLFRRLHWRPVVFIAGIMPSSFTQSRHPSAAGPLPMARSTRVSFGPNGVCAFATGKRCCIERLAALDAAASAGGGVARAVELAEPLLEVRLHGGARCEREEGNLVLPTPAALEGAVREFKDAEGAASAIQEAERARQRERQHLWKLVQALLAATLRPAAGGELGLSEEQAALMAAKRREAVRSWLRLALAAPTAAGLPAEGGAAALELCKGLQPDGAVESAIADDNDFDFWRVEICSHANSICVSPSYVEDEFIIDGFLEKVKLPEADPR